MKKIIMLIMVFMLCFGIGFANAESGINFGDITEVNGSDLTQNYIYADYDYSLNETESAEFDIILLELNYMYDDEYVSILEYTYGLVEPWGNLFYSNSEYINFNDGLTPLVSSFNEIDYDGSISQDFGLVAENESMVYEIFSENLASASVSGYRIIELTSLDNLTGAEFDSMSVDGEDALVNLYVIEDDGNLKEFTLGGWNVTDLKNLKMIFEGSEPLVFDAGVSDYLMINQTIAIGYGNNYSISMYYTRSLLGDYPDNKVLWAFNTTNLWSGDYELKINVFCSDSLYTTESRYYTLTSDIVKPVITIIDSPVDDATITDNYIDVQVEYDYSSYLNEGWNFEKIIIYATDEELNYVNHLAYEHIDYFSYDLNNITRLYLGEGTYIYNVYVELYNADLNIIRHFRTDYQTINIEAEEAEMTTNLDTENQLINLITIFLILGMIYFLYDKIFKGKK